MDAGRKIKENLKYIKIFENLRQFLYRDILLEIDLDNQP